VKKITRRAVSVLLIVCLLLIGCGVFLLRLYRDGEDWAMFRANPTVYRSGLLSAGTVYDREGAVLASAEDGRHSYALDPRVRRACLHAVGDYYGYIGTGVLQAFSGDLSGYSRLSGTYRRPDAQEPELTLSISAQLSVAALDALGDRSGAITVMNWQTGELLCMVSTPGYDPELPVDMTGAEGIFLNRAISAAYTPGSTFKIVTLCAAIENIGDLFDRTFYCGGSVTIDGGEITCTGQHGYQTVEQAFANSCNCAFAQLSLELGADTLERYAQALGLCSGLEIDGIPTAAGSFEKAREGSSQLAWSGIGQYNDLAVPYAMARLCAAIAAGGTAREGTLVLGRETASTQLMSAETAGALARLMSYNVVYGYGQDSFPGLELCAKSGTAEVGDGSSHAWFTGFLSDSSHPYAFCVVIEHGGWGLAQAGRAANTVLQCAVDLGL